MFCFSEKANQVLIPTVETARQSYFLEKLLNNNKQILIIGPSGTGKTKIINDYLFKLPKDKYILNNLNFSARITANQSQEAIMAKIARRRKGVYGPPMEKNMIIFVDDLNMPVPEKYGSQPPIELLRQLADHRFFYDK